MGMVLIENLTPNLKMIFSFVKQSFSISNSNNHKTYWVWDWYDMSNLVQVYGKIKEDHNSKCIGLLHVLCV